MAVLRTSRFESREEFPDNRYTTYKTSGIFLFLFLQTRKGFGSFLFIKIEEIVL